MEDNTLAKKIYWLYLIGFFLILALPVLNLPPWFSPADWGKIIVFRIVLSILIFLFISQILFKKFVDSHIIRRFTSGGLASWLLIALFGIYLLATIFSLDRNFSLWGSPYRSGGFVNFAFYIIFALLTLFILKEKDWQKIWDFGIIVGILVSLVAIFQNFSILSQIFIPRKIEIVSTVSLPSALGIYLLLLGFLTFSFLLKEKKLWKKFFYLISFFFLFSGVALSHSQAAYLGTTVAFVWFLFFYDSRGIKKIIFLKIIAAILIIVGFGGLYFLKTHPQNPLSKNSIISVLSSWGIDQSRISAWKVSWEAVKERPVLGYGPENFSIGFDRYYDPSLPGIEKDPGFHSSWWDRAHNFIFDISVTAGIPALIIYFSLFAVIFWQLQKVKKREPSQSLICHGIQATFIGYLLANFFSFDTFSTYLISFLLIGYSLFLIKENCVNNETAHKNPQKAKQKYTDGKLWKYVFLFVLFCALLWLNWQYNIKPLQINAEINAAKYLVENKKCEQAISGIKKYVLPKKSILNYYARIKYIDFMRDCKKDAFEETLEYAGKGLEISKESAEIRPYYTRNWLFLSGFNAMLIFGEEDPQKKAELIKKGEEYLKKAEELSPKRQEVFIEWAKYAFVSDRYELLKEKSQRCVNANPKLADCYWYRGLAQIILGELEEGKKDIELAKEKGYSCDSFISLEQLKIAHSTARNYEELVLIYQKLISLKPEEPQYYATLAFVYKELGRLEEAKKQALKIIELFPEHKKEAEEFLKSLK